MNSRKELYKYLCPEGVVRSLQNSTILFRKPPDFNDPFDVQPGRLIHISAEDISNYAAKKIAREFKTGAIRARVSPPMDKDFANFIENQIQHYSVMPEGDLIGLFDSDQEREQWSKLLEDTAEDLRNGFENTFISCFTENHSSLLMWAHYAQSHKGAILKFRMHPSSDFSLISHAKKVCYTRRPPVLASKRAWLGFLDDPHKVAFENDSILKVLTSKSREWSYEREWRIVIPPRGTGAFNAFSNGVFTFDPMELEAVYLGYRIDEQVQNEILECCRIKYPHANIFVGHKSEKKFKILYEEYRS